MSTHKTTINPFVPSNINRAKRMAKTLHKRFHQHPLSKCQETIAMLMDHKDWHALEQAINANMPSAPDDYEIDEENGISRAQRQAELFCRQMFKKQLNPSAKILAGTAADIVQRLDNAGDRYASEMTYLMLEELQPTVRKQSPAGVERPIYEIFGYCSADDLQRLPTTLGVWFESSVPDQPDVARALKEYDLDPLSRSSILAFAWYWGVISVHYAHTVPVVMSKGVSFLLGSRYAALSIVTDLEFNASGDMPTDPFTHATNLHLKHLRRFYICNPHDDYVGAFDKQAVAFQDAAEHVMDHFFG